MHASQDGAGDDSLQSPDENRLSYKFQRLRERLRQAIVSGELSGKLPGERQLARRFKVNAKTLSKALTDLAADGLLERSIGRGTFVKGSTPAATSTTEKWLVVADPGDATHSVLSHLTKANPSARIVTEVTSFRPSFINQFSAVLICTQVPDSFVRELLVRGVSTIFLGRAPKKFSTHAVLVDRAHGGTILARQLFQDGHRRVLTIEPQGETTLATSMRTALARLAPDATVDAGALSEIAAAVEHGVTAIVCGRTNLAQSAVNELARLDVAVPGAVTLLASGCADEPLPCSGCYASAQSMAQVAIELLKDKQNHRPNVVWLSGEFLAAGTHGPAGTPGRGLGSSDAGRFRQHAPAG